MGQDTRFNKTRTRGKSAPLPDGFKVKPDPRSKRILDAKRAQEAKKAEKAEAKTKGKEGDAPPTDKNKDSKGKK